MWFHREAKVDDWLLYVVESTNANAGRAFLYRKNIFKRRTPHCQHGSGKGLIRKL
ncbi:MAG: hypothetical protein IPN10_00245 [Saprospiraceae bacterium]|nr:hypothetical protein [Saprospiraceae bacterium]